MSTTPSAPLGPKGASPAQAAPRPLLDVLRFGIVMLDTRGRILLWSPTAEEILGWQDTQVVGQHLTKLLPDGTEDPGTEVYRTLLRHRHWHGSLWLLHRDGTPIKLESRASLLRDGKGIPFILANLVESRRALAVEQDLAALDALFSASPLGIGIFDTTLRFTRVNDALCELYGTTTDRLLGQTIVDALPQPLAQEIHQLQQEVLDSGQSVTDLVTIAPNGRGAQSLSFGRLTDRVGQTIGVSYTVMDVTERREALEKIERARRRLALLDDVGMALGDHFDVHGIADALAHILVPRFADQTGVLLLSAVAHGGDLPPHSQLTGSPLLQVSAAAKDASAEAERMMRMEERVDFEPGSVFGTVLTSGNPHLLLSQDELPTVTHPDDPRVQAALDLGIHSMLTVPLRARGTVLGLLVAGRAGERAAYEQDDMSLAMEIAGRASISLDNARLYAREREGALVLQRNLLPQRVPEPPGVHISYRYVPSSSGAEAGGDWFDVIPLAGDRVAFVIGDVMGHGLRAAATMGRLRTAVATLAGLDMPPAELLRRINDLGEDLSHRPDEPLMATGAYVVYDPSSHDCTFAMAGHLPPVLVTREETTGRWHAEALDLPAGGPLGVEGIEFEEERISVPEGAILVLYTDGLVERRDADLTQGIDRLCALLSRITSPTPSLNDICDEIIAALGPTGAEPVSGPGTADDIALLIARLGGLPEGSAASWTFPAETFAVRRARAVVRQTLVHWGLAPVIDDAVLLVSELVTNSLRYASGPIGVRMVRGTSLLVEVSDPLPDPPRRRAPSTDDEGGRGLQLVAREARRWGTRQGPIGKTVWFELGLPAPKHH